MIAPARLAAFDALLAVSRGARDLGDALDGARASLADPRDVALCHQVTVGTVRWRGRLDFALARLSKQPLERLDLEVLTALRMGAYQLFHLSRVPAAAVVHDAVALVRRARKTSAAGLVNAVLRRLAGGAGRDLPPRPDRPPDAAMAPWVEHLAVLHAHPAWLVERWLARRPLADVEAWLAFNNAPPAVAMRVNPLMAETPAAVIGELAADGVVATASPVVPWGVRVEHGPAATSRVIAAGTAVIQDEGSQLAGRLAPVRPGDLVLDVCAAPGGKALQYAAAAGAGGRVVACDVRPARLRLLAATLARGGAAGAAVVALDPEAPLPFAGRFDVVVVDAPCSGLGTLRRDPDIKWRRQAADLPRFAARQRDLLGRAAACVRPGGHLVYTTCSTEPEENERVVSDVVATLSGFTLARPSGDAAIARCLDADGSFRTDPVRDGLEGYFGALLVRAPA
ncbi:MAG: RsmB/NOP family class I SAM-dependent RNA methyltransferase [Vicinamibacterales bacterium]